MGEKGNMTSAELASATAAAESGLGAVVAGAGTTVTAVFGEAGDTLKDKVIDKSADAAIAGAQERWRRRDGADDTVEEAADDGPPSADDTPGPDRP